MNKPLVIVIAILSSAAAGNAAANIQLAQKNACMGCHAVDR